MRQLVPDQVLSSVLDIDLVALKGRGIKGLLIDLDNTIVRWGESYMEPVFASWIRKARQAGFEVCLVSNAMPSRVEAFASKLSVPSVSQAMKPLGRAFRRALQVLGLNAQEVAVIGDRYLQMCTAATACLYNPHQSSQHTELRSTRFMRRLERRLFKTMAKRGLVSPAVLGIAEKGALVHDQTRAGAVQTCRRKILENTVTYPQRLGKQMMMIWFASLLSDHPLQQR